MSSISALGPNQIPKNPKVNQVFVCGNSKYIFNGKYEWEEIENYELERRKREKEEWVPHSQRYTRSFKSIKRNKT